MRVEVLEQREPEGLESLERAARAKGHSLHDGPQRLGRVGDDPQEQLLPGGEVAKERRLGHAERAGDLASGQLIEGTVREQRQSGLDDLPPPHGGFLSPESERHVIA